MAWYDSEQLGSPTSQTIEIGRAWRFQFGLPGLVRDSLPPARGTDVSALHPFSSVGCAGITGYGARVRDVQISKAAGKCAMTVDVVEPLSFVPPVGSAAANELMGSRTEGGTWDINTGEMIHVTTDGVTGVPVRGSTYYTTYSGAAEGGYNGRICYEQHRDPNMVPGLVIVRSRFKTKGAVGYREAGVARVRGETANRQTILTREHASNGGKWINGIDYSKTPPEKWEVSKGSPVAVEGMCMLVIETAFSTLNLGAQLFYLNTVNSGALTRIGLGDKTCLMLGYGFTKWWQVGSLFYFDYRFLYNPDGWDAAVESQKLLQGLYPVFVKDADGKDTTEKRTILDWRPKTALGSDIAPVARAPWKYASWSALDGMVSW